MPSDTHLCGFIHAEIGLCEHGLESAGLCTAGMGSCERDVLELLLRIALGDHLLEALGEVLRLWQLRLLGLGQLLAHRADLLVDLRHLRLVVGRSRLLVIAQDGDVLVGNRVVVIERDKVTLLGALLRGDKLVGLGKLRAERDRRVVRTEDLHRGQS